MSRSARTVAAIGPTVRKPTAALRRKVVDPSLEVTRSPTKPPTVAHGDHDRDASGSVSAAHDEAQDPCDDTAQDGETHGLHVPQEEHCQREIHGTHLLERW